MELNLPAKAGRFRMLLKQPKVVIMVKLSVLVFSSKSWSLIYCAIISSVTFPLLATKHPRAHKCYPQNCLFSSLYSICNLHDVFPLIYCTNLLADRRGETDTRRCVWSFPTCPAIISTSFAVHIIRINSQLLCAIFPTITSFLYFVIHTIWYFMSCVQCDDFR